MRYNNAMNTLCKNEENSKTEKEILNPAFRGIIAENYSLSALSSFRVGGDAAFFIEPFSQKSLLFALDYLKNRSFFILGGASNIVVADEGIPIPVLSTRSLQKISLVKPSENENTFFLSAEAGTSIESIIDFCIQEELSGLETFAGLPGSIGGAVYMNARCYDVSISEKISKIRYIDCNNRKNNKKIDEKSLFEVYNVDEKDWDYKKSPFQNSKKLIVEVFLRVEKGDKKKIQGLSAQYFADREQKGHFKYPSAGSVFKNNRAFGKPSGKIIDEAGLRGLEIGGAQIAPWHGNIIINKGSATAKDIAALVELVQKKVKEKYGFYLEPEILFSDLLLQ